MAAVRKGGAPAGGAGAAGAAGRSLVSDRRVLGCVQEWNLKFGWAVPLETVSHPQARKRGGRIYVDQKDVRGERALAAGSTVDFLVYCDMRGLGAADVRELPPEAADRATAGVGGERGEAEAEADGAAGELPPGWEEVWSKEHQRHYYWHRPSKEASWERPPEAAPTEHGGEPPLPAGWERHFDTEHQECYYWHKATKKASWERPQGAEEAGGADADGPDAEEEEEEEPDDAGCGAGEAPGGGPALAQRRLQGRVTKWQSFFGWIAPLEDVGPDLMPLLIANQEKIYVNWRDIQSGTELQVGAHVDFGVYADDSGLCASDVCLHGEPALAKEPLAAPPQEAGRGQKRRGRAAAGRGRAAPQDPLERLKKDWAKQDKKLGVVAPAPAAAGADEEEPPEADENPEGEADGPLLPGWEQHWDEERGCSYYWHAATKQSAWERPAVPEDDDAGGTAYKVWKGEGAEQGAAGLATPMTPIVSRPGRGMTPITPGAGPPPVGARAQPLPTRAPKPPPAPPPAFERAAPPRAPPPGPGWAAVPTRGRFGHVPMWKRPRLY